MKLTTNVHIAPTLGMSGAIPSLSPFQFIALTQTNLRLVLRSNVKIPYTITFFFFTRFCSLYYQLVEILCDFENQRSQKCFKNNKIKFLCNYLILTNITHTFQTNVLIQFLVSCTLFRTSCVHHQEEHLYVHFCTVCFSC